MPAQLTSCAPSVLPVDRTPLERLPRLASEREVLGARLRVLERERGRISPAVYSRLRAEYLARLGSLEATAGALRRTAHREYGRLCTLVDEFTCSVGATRLDQEELKLHHWLGYLDGGELELRLRVQDSLASHAETRLRMAGRMKAAYRALLASDGERLTRDAPQWNRTTRVDAAVPSPTQVLERPRAGSLALLPARLRVEGVPGTAVEHELVFELTRIGRSLSNQICLESLGVSRRHAQIRRGRGGYTIRDLGSGNGTFVNGSRLEESLLIDGDTIRVGDTELRFVQPPA